MNLSRERLSADHRKLLVIARWVIRVLMVLLGKTSQPATIIVPAGEDQQAAKDIAQHGHTGLLQSGGVSFRSGDFTALNLMNVDAGSSYITITCSVAQPADSTCVILSHRSAMPKLIACVGSPGRARTRNVKSTRTLASVVFLLAMEGVEYLAILTVGLLKHLALAAVVLAYLIAGTWLKELFIRTYLNLEPKYHCTQAPARDTANKLKCPRGVKPKLKTKKVERNRPSKKADLDGILPCARLSGNEQDINPRRFASGAQTSACGRPDCRIHQRCLRHTTRRPCPLPGAGTLVRRRSHRGN